MAKAKHIKKPIAFQADTITRENLPYPIVYYPNFYGTFFAFRATPDAPLMLCSCTKVAIENYVALCLSQTIPQNIDLTRMFVLDSFDFPSALISELMSANRSAGAEVLGHLRFEHRLCHKCNQAVPSLRYCHEMYGTAFIQSYGWYVRQAYFRLGMWPCGDAYLPDVCPLEFQTEIEAVKKIEREFQQENERLQKIASGPKRPDIADDEVTYWRNVREEEAQPMIRLHRKASQARRAFTKKIENIVRQEFGYRKVGEGWISETILCQIVSKIYSGREVLFHHRPEWLNGLELDIYIPDAKTAFEYQGLQHYRPIKGWGGEKAFEELKRRDAQKAALCKQLGIRLIKVDYTEPLTESYIRMLLDNTEQSTAIRHEA